MKLLSPLRNALLLSATLLANCQSDLKSMHSPPTAATTQTKPKGDSFDPTVILVMDKFKTNTVDITGDKIPDVPHGLLVQASLDDNCLKRGKDPATFEMIHVENDLNQDGQMDRSELLKAVLELEKLVKTKKIAAINISMSLDIPLDFFRG
ncbi:MAG: hypothetical protein QE263_00735 [Vampirovibrionales bacterium]|nr:hypothetical protein [Vampirovibrionales bacterium]